MVRDVGFRGKILDAGSGQGAFAEIIAESDGVELFTLDLNSDAESRRFGMRHIVADIHALPYANATFDGIWCSNTLMYSPRPQLAMTEFGRVVRPGGLIAVKEEDVGRDILASWDPELDLALRSAWGAALRSGEVAGDGYMGRKVPQLFCDLRGFAFDVRSYVIDRTGPFDSTFRAYLRQAFLEYLPIYRKHLRAPAYRHLIRILSDDGEPESFLYSRASHVVCLETVVVGRKMED